jgi:FixJ family two-component response regulator
MGPQQAVVHVLDDDPSFQTAIGRLLRSCGYRVVQYESATQALKEIPRRERGCILLDVQMPGMNGMQFQEKLKTLKSTLPIVFVTGHNDVQSGVQAIKAGAVDYLTKPVAKKVLLDVIAHALEQNAKLQKDLARYEAVRAMFSTLSEQELDIVAMVVRGFLNKQIANQLDVSLRTVKTRRQTAMKKLKTKSIPALVSIAIEFGLVVG